MPWAITPTCYKCRKKRAVRGSRLCPDCKPDNYEEIRERVNANKKRQLEADPVAREHYRFYKSKPWREMRAYKLRLNPLCEECESHGRVVPGREVDHKTRLKDGGDPFDLSNLRTLCKSCHARKRASEGHATLGKRGS